MENQKNYSEQIIKAYNNWIKKQDAEVEEEWYPKYKNLKAAAKRAGDKFEKLCVSEGLNYCNVYSELMGSLNLKVMKNQ